MVRRTDLGRQDKSSREGSTLESAVRYGVEDHMR